ncbi:hypothetical protein OAO87_03735 [bacterium]|nr:hypothetical protein [bacterium]
MARTSLFVALPQARDGSSLTYNVALMLAAVAVVLEATATVLATASRLPRQFPVHPRHHCGDLMHDPPVGVAAHSAPTERGHEYP